MGQPHWSKAKMTARIVVQLVTQSLPLLVMATPSNLLLLYIYIYIYMLAPNPTQSHPTGVTMT